MPFAARHRDDPTPPLEPLPDLAVRRETDAALMAALQGRGEVEMARRLILMSLQHDLEQMLDLEGHYGVAVASTSDAKEGTMAFLEKRKPVFRGT